MEYYTKKIQKSVSRFARNTVDSLLTIRKLKEKNVAVVFEKEGVNTLDGTGKDKWYDSVIFKMLRNEKYMGDALLQKTYTLDFMTKKKMEDNLNSG